MDYLVIFLIVIAGAFFWAVRRRSVRRGGRDALREIDQFRSSLQKLASKNDNPFRPKDAAR